MTPGKITVMQVFAAMGITPSSEVAWSVVARVAKAYADIVGEQPPKENRPKTGGGGTHCFAVYPLAWQPTIEAIIRTVVKEESAQQGLFA